MRPKRVTFLKDNFRRVAFFCVARYLLHIKPKEEPKWTNSLQHDFITIKQCVNYYGFSERPFLRMAKEAGAYYKRTQNSK